MYSYNSSASTSWFAYALGSLAVCVILGLVTKHINESKGYSGGFAWGFWLNLIGVIVVACKPDNRTNAQNNVYSGHNVLEQEALDRKTLAEGGWRCSCGRINPHYTTTCACQRHKADVLREQQDKKEIEKKAHDSSKEAEQIRQLAKLHSEGILSDEEFEAKKAELLSRM